MSDSQERKPNIVLIMTDQQRWDTLGCLGFDHMITPNIDRLVERGVAFNQAFVQGLYVALRATVLCLGNMCIRMALSAMRPG